MDPATDTRAAAGPAGLVHGVDVGGTKVAAGAMERGRVTALAERATDRSSSEAVVAGIEHAIEELRERAGPPAAIGVGVPSQIDFATGEVLASVNIPLRGVRLRERLERRFGVPAYVDNDGNCAALAESHAGPGPPARALVMLTLGTGVGGGIVAGGAVLRGATGLGAELGHLVVDGDGPPCPGDCPNRGCLEALVSGLALARDGEAAARRSPGSALGRVLEERGAVSARDAAAAARAGDRDALELFERFAFWLGAGMSGLLNAFEPERLVVGGGLSREADLFFERAREAALRRVLPAIARRSQVALARTGPEAGVLGAALLAAREYDGGGGHT